LGRFYITNILINLDYVTKAVVRAAAEEEVVAKGHDAILHLFKKEMAKDGRIILSKKEDGIDGRIRMLKKANNEAVTI
jgi:hypothetical protein